MARVDAQPRVGDHTAGTACWRPVTLGSGCSGGSVCAALAAGICCLGPLLFAALGLSTFASLWLLRLLVPYRHLFFAGTVVLLGVGFYAVYRRGGQTRVRDKVILWASTLMVLAVVSYSLYVEGVGVFEPLR
jgi:mercuric ion transport protein